MAEKQAYQTLVLQTLNKDTVIEDSSKLSLDDKPVNQMELLGVLNALWSREVSNPEANLYQMISYESITLEVWHLTQEGREIAETGSHEARVFYAVPLGSEGISIGEMTVFHCFLHHRNWWEMLQNLAKGPLLSSSGLPRLLQEI
jgi:phenylalanyl-tRNA synthetase alpha chain